MKSFFFNLKYSILISIKEREFLFWFMIFPLILCSAYYLAFSNLDKEESLNVKLGIIDNNPFEVFFEKIPIIELVKGTEEELNEKLLLEEIDGYLDSNYEINVANSMTQAKILVNIVESVKRYSISYIIKANNNMNLDLNNDDILDYSLKDIASYMNEPDKMLMMSPKISDFLTAETLTEYKNQNASILSIILFSSFAMFSLYGKFLGIHFMEHIQAYLNPIGLRLAVSPQRKSSLIISTFLTAFIMNLIFNMIIVLFVHFVLCIHLFVNIKMSFLILLFANLFGNSAGVLIGINKTFTEKQKTAFVNSSLLIMAFICGMAGNTSARQAIEKHAPIFNLINPVNLVNESLYQVNYIGDLSVLPRNLGILFAGSVILLTISGLILRRKSYDSL